MTLIVYGIRNCNTVKSAIDWLKQNGVGFTFYDLKASGVDEKRLRSWVSQVDWEVLVNKRGTTWRQLPPEIKDKVSDQEGAIQVMLEKPTVIKRPVIESGAKIMSIGFDPEVFHKKFI